MPAIEIGSVSNNYILGEIPPPGNKAEIIKLFVKEPRRTGIGSRLLRDFEHRAITAGAKIVFITVDPDPGESKETLTAFITKRGYQQEDPHADNPIRYRKQLT